MNAHEQRIAIAEACGWRGFRNSNSACGTDISKGEAMLWEFSWTPPRNASRDDYQNYWHALPQYLDDLNAMHEAEKILTPYQSEQYAEMMLAVLDIPTPFIGTARCAYITGHATAAQRAEAFLRTLGLWINSNPAP